MLTDQDLVEQIMDVIKSLDDVPSDLTKEITTSTNISRDLKLDSIAVMDFVMAIETRFDIVIPIDKISEIETIADLADVVGAKLAKPVR